METVEHLIVGAGPAGLRAGQVLAQAGREALVAEKRSEIGPKTCAGGLTPKTVALLRGLGLPESAGVGRIGRIAFTSGRPVMLDPERTTVVTLTRRQLGAFQAAWTRAAGAEVRAACTVSEIDLVRRTALVGGRCMGWRHLIGADGSDSAVRRALGLRSPRVYFAAEYNLPGVHLEPLRVECDRGLGGGYFRLGLGDRGAPLEGATLEVDFRGLHFPDGIHLAGDAAGVPSALTAEGIYAALITGEEVARGILGPGYRSERLARWLGVKRRHDRFALFLRRPSARAATLSLLEWLARWRLARAPMADWFLAG